MVRDRGKANRSGHTGGMLTEVVRDWGDVNSVRDWGNDNRSVRDRGHARGDWQKTIGRGYVVSSC